MIIYVVAIFVKPEFRDAFIEATLENARNTRKEPTNIRFDVLQSVDDPNRFTLYEVYKEGGVTAHKATEHYKKWRATVEEMMAKPRKGIQHSNIFPTSENGFLSVD
ncbi:MAG: putative quinol monooxygenase [Candidatus Helarchaeota archaeon]